MSQEISIIDRDEQELAPMLDPGSGLPGAASQQVSPLKIIMTLLKGRWKWAISLAVLGALIGGILGYFLANKPEYRSVGIIQIKPYVPGVFSNEANPIPMFDAYIDSQLVIIQSRRTIDMAMQNPDWRALGRGLSDQAVADFQSHLQVNRTGIDVLVAFFDADPAASRTAVKCIIQAYQSIYDDANTGDENRRSDILENLKNKYQTELTRLRASMAQDFGPSSVETTYQFKLEELNRLESQLKSVQLELNVVDATTQAAATQAASTKTEKSTTLPTLTADMVASVDPMVRDELVTLSKLQANLHELLDRYGANYPNVISVRSQIQALQDQINDQVRKYQGRVRTGPNASPGEQSLIPGVSNISIEQARLRAKGLADEIAQLKADLKDLGSRNLQIEDLKDQAAKIQEQLDATKARIQQLTVENQIGGRISVITNGTTDIRPIDKRKQMTAAGTFGGALFGFGIILAIAYLDQRVKHVADAQSRISGGNRMLGVLPRLPEDISDPGQASIAAYCVHHIRTLLQISAANNQQVVAVSSPSPGDGKTSLAVALGLSYAASSSKTLLIDCDVIGGGLTARMNSVIRRKIGDVLVRLGHASPEQIDDALKAAQTESRRLGEILVERKVVTQEQLDQALQHQQESLLGLLDALDGEPVLNCIGATGTPNLDILPLGNANANHAAQLSPRLLRRILTQAREHYDAVIIDTGPVLGSLEACVAAAEADGVVLTVSRGGLRSLAQSAIAQLDAVGAHVLGIVFNRALAEDITSSGFSSPISTASIRVNGNPEEPVRGGLVKLGPVARAVAANTATGSNGTRLN
ncbi:MAG: exopolysaccharide transport family protein [Phycisphaerae bacterium]